VPLDRRAKRRVPDAGLALPGCGPALSAIADVYGVAEASLDGTLGPTPLIAFTVK
jgi:hypothetical protein